MTLDPAATLSAEDTEEDPDARPFLSRARARVDPRFDSYVTLYNNLDNLLWRIPTYFAAVSALNLALLVVVLGTEPRIETVSRQWLGGGILSVWGIQYCLGVFSMSRIRFHHDIAGRCLLFMELPLYGESKMRIEQEIRRRIRKEEGKGQNQQKESWPAQWKESAGYFQKRLETIQQKQRSAPHWYMAVFGILGRLLLGAGVGLLAAAIGQFGDRLVVVRLIGELRVDVVIVSISVLLLAIV